MIVFKFVLEKNTFVSLRQGIDTSKLDERYLE